MDAILNPVSTAEPSAEGIARMQAEMQKMWVEIESCHARLETSQLEIDRLRTETHDILALLAEIMKR